MKNTIVTDREILRCIHDMYQDQYPGPELAGGKRQNDPYLPIAVREVAARLGTAPEMLFGRLYYHLDAKYRYKYNAGAETHLFAMKVGEKMHCVHFPYLSAVLAEREAEHRQFWWTLWLSIAALVLSAASIVSQVVTTK